MLIYPNALRKSMTSAELISLTSFNLSCISSIDFDSSNAKLRITAFKPNAMGSVFVVGFFPPVSWVICFYWFIIVLYDNID